jgi:hypothetical protein
MLIASRSLVGGSPVPPPRRPRRDLPLSLGLASGLVLVQALVGLAAALGVLALACGAALALSASWLLGAGMGLIGGALLGGFGALLLAAVGLRRLRPWSRPVVVGAEGLFILCGALLIARGAAAAGAATVLLGCLVTAAISTPAARLALAARPPVVRRSGHGGAVPLRSAGARRPRWRPPVIRGRAPAAPAPGSRRLSPPPPSWWELIGFGLPRLERPLAGPLAPGDEPS